MHEQQRALLLAISALAVAGLGCIFSDLLSIAASTPAPAPTSTPNPVSNINSLCLDVEVLHNEPTLWNRPADPLRPGIEEILENRGIEIVSEVDHCDASLSMTFTTSLLTGERPKLESHCFYGAEVTIEGVLTSKSGASQEWSLTDRIENPIHNNSQQCGDAYAHSVPKANRLMRQLSLQSLVMLWDDDVLETAGSVADEAWENAAATVAPTLNTPAQ